MSEATLIIIAMGVFTVISAWTWIFLMLNEIKKLLKDEQRRARIGAIASSAELQAWHANATQNIADIQGASAQDGARLWIGQDEG